MKAQLQPCAIVHCLLERSSAYGARKQSCNARHRVAAQALGRTSVAHGPARKTEISQFAPPASGRPTDRTSCSLKDSAPTHGAQAPRAAHGGLGRKVVHDGGWVGPSAASEPVRHTTSTKRPSRPFWRPSRGLARSSAAPTVRAAHADQVAPCARPCAVLASRSPCWSPASLCGLARHARARS